MRSAVLKGYPLPGPEDRQLEGFGVARTWTELPTGRVVRLQAENAENAGALTLAAASATRHFGPFLADLAELSLRRTAALPFHSMTRRPLHSTTGLPPHSTTRRGGFPPEVRAAGLARVLAAGFGRDRAVILLHVPQGLTPAGEDVLVSGAEWLADRGGFGVWLTGAPLTAVDRLATVTVRLPASVASGDDVPALDDAPLPRLIYPPVAGMPHPGSQVEKALEAALRECRWAAGRAWNQTHQSSPLTPLIRVDLLWRDERCVVEIDGDEHRHANRYEEDRRRDMLLQTDGYAVLRFTNTQVMTEMDLVLRHLERFLESRRSGTFKGLHHG
jgi:very-short-patch-repair endonuclease